MGYLGVPRGGCEWSWLRWGAFNYCSVLPLFEVGWVWQEAHGGEQGTAEFGLDCGDWRGGVCRGIEHDYWDWYPLCRGKLRGPLQTSHHYLSAPNSQKPKRAGTIRRGEAYIAFGTNRNEVGGRGATLPVALGGLTRGISHSVSWTRTIHK